MFDRINATRLAVLTALQVFVARLTPAPARLAPAAGLSLDRRGATMIEYVLFAAFGVAVALIMWTLVMPEADSVMQQIQCLFQAGADGAGASCN